MKFHPSGKRRSISFDDLDLPHRISKGSIYYLMITVAVVLLAVSSSDSLLITAVQNEFLECCEDSKKRGIKYKLKKGNQNNLLQ